MYINETVFTTLLNRREKQQKKTKLGIDIYKKSIRSANPTQDKIKRTDSNIKSYEETNIINDVMEIKKLQD